MNEHNDVVILELDKPRTLRLGHRALRKFCALTGCRLSELETVGDRYDLLSQLIYVMLAEEDPTLTPARVDELLDACSVTEIIGKTAAALVAALDSGAETPAAGDGTAGPTAAAGTGARA